MARRGRRPAHFVLSYVPSGVEPVTVGHLRFDGTIWSFEYDDAYKDRVDLRPIEGFDDVDRVYQSSALFPFFAVRVPDLDRSDVRQRLDEDRIHDPELTDMLRLFGRRAISSPAFELLPA